MDFIAPKPTQDYKVLIKCMTYNQEKYIEDALKGFVRQKTNFPFCALVVDDCSTDGNAEIIKRYEREYPDIIKGIYLPVNMYGNPEKRKYIQPWEERAQYIAYCEGDDYWIDENKLQRQVDFLDSHPDYMMHFHNAIIRFQDSDAPDRLLSNFETGDFSTAKIFEKWQLPLASVLLRKEVLDAPVLAELYKVFRGGFCLFITASRIGKVYGLSECLSVYRKNEGGVSNKMSPAYCMQLNYSFAKASGDADAMKVMDERALRSLKDLIIPYMRGNEDAKEMKCVIDKYNKSLFYKAFISVLVHLPWRVCIKIKAILARL